jgi:hypothetical protein
VEERENDVEYWKVKKLRINPTTNVHSLILIRIGTTIEDGFTFKKSF